MSSPFYRSKNVKKKEKKTHQITELKFFLTCPACLQIPTIFYTLNSNCSNLCDMKNLQEQVKKALCYQNLF